MFNRFGWIYIYNGDADSNRYWKGTMVMRYGSVTARFTYFIFPLEAIKEKVNDLRWTLSTSTELTGKVHITDIKK